MGTSRIVSIMMVLMAMTEGLSTPPRESLFADPRTTATTPESYTVPDSRGSRNKNHNSEWQNDSWGQSVTSRDYGDRSTQEPNNRWGTTEDSRSDSWSRDESSTQPSTRWSDSTISILGRTTIRGSLDYTTTFSPQGVSRHRSCGIVPSPGECQAAFPRYYYNESTSQCDCYIFGGCDEGEGSYSTLEECHQKCRPENKEEGPNCKFVYVSFSSDQYTTTTRTTVQEPDLVNQGTSWPPMLKNITSSLRNHSQSNFGSSAHEVPRRPEDQLGFGNVTTISPASESQNGSTAWSPYTTTPRTQSASSVDEEQLHWSCEVFLTPGKCDIGFPRYYYNHTSSQCNCYNYTVCGESDSFSSLEECIRTCNPIFKDQGPSCPVPVAKKSGFSSSFDNTNISESDSLSENGTTGSSSTQDTFSSNRTSSFGSSSSWGNEKPDDYHASSSASGSAWGSDSQYSENRRHASRNSASSVPGADD